MSTLKQLARVPSYTLIKLLREKYPAFVPARVTKSAKEQGANLVTKQGNGYFVTSSSYDEGYGDQVFYVEDDGRFVVDYGSAPGCGLRVAFGCIYNSESRVVQSCKYVTKKQESYLDHMKECTAPVVRFGRKEYIWLNMEDCESGKDKVMMLINLRMGRKAVPFSEENDYNDYARATKLHNQAEEDVLEFATEEEKAMIVPMILTSEDGYESQTYLLPQDGLGREPGME